MSEELTLEKLKISERLASLETRHESMCGKIDEIHTALMGNGNVGLIKSVDRLEQTVTGWKANVKVVWVAIIGLVVKAFWSLFDK